MPRPTDNEIQRSDELRGRLEHVLARRFDGDRRAFTQALVDVMEEEGIEQFGGPDATTPPADIALVSLHKLVGEKRAWLTPNLDKWGEALDAYEARNGVEPELEAAPEAAPARATDTAGADERVTELTERLAELERQLREREVQLENAQEALASHPNRVTELEQQLDDARREMALVGSQVDDKAREIEGLRQQLDARSDVDREARARYAQILLVRLEGTHGGETIDSEVLERLDKLTGIA